MGEHLFTLDWFDVCHFGEKARIPYDTGEAEMENETPIFGGWCQCATNPELAWITKCKACATKFSASIYLRITLVPQLNALNNGKT